ncbi:MAG: hypothetical protein AAF806_19290 [Bacteroidota bacterium]
MNQKIADSLQKINDLFSKIPDMIANNEGIINKIAEEVKNKLEENNNQ